MYTKPIQVLRLCLLSAVFLLSCQIANAQVQTIPPPLVDQDTVLYAIAPALLYTSDLGLVGGGLVTRFQYEEGFYPYKNITEVRLLLSTRGMINFRTAYEHTQTFGYDIRSLWDLNVDRLLDNYYFGLGNESEFDSDLFNDGYFDFESRAAGLSYRGRIPVYRNETTSRLDVLALANVSYYTPWVGDDDESLINMDHPLGMDGGFINYLGTGIRWDNRDSEFAPTRGTRFNAETYFSNSIFASDYNYTSLTSTASQYYSIGFLAGTTIALRAGSAWKIGDAPFWRIPSLGGENSVRGYVLNRFRGDGSVFYNAEIRNWVFVNEVFEFKIGVHAFTDGGRVFMENEPFTPFDNLHQTYGGGIAFQLFGPDFILRIEYARSEDVGRLYMGTGYMF